MNKQATATDTQTKTVERLVEVWNDAGVVRHDPAVVRRYFKKRHFETVEAFGIEAVEKAIRNYATVYRGASYYWSHKWPLWDFIGRSNGVPQFVDEMEPLKNFSKGNTSESRQRRLEDESIARALSLE